MCFARKFERHSLLLIVVQAWLAAGAVVMSFWAGLPWVGPLGFTILGASAIAAEIAPAGVNGAVWRWSSLVGWVCTLAIPAGLFLLDERHFSVAGYLDHFFAVLAWIVAGSLLPACGRAVDPALRTRWRLPVMTWSGFGCLVWIAVSYLEDQRGAFHVSLAMLVAWMIFWRLWFRLRPWAIQLLHTAMLLAIALPLTDAVLRPGPPARVEAGRLREYYSYEQARRDPQAFNLWWDRLGEEVGSMASAVMVIGSSDSEPFRLKPGSRGRFFESDIAINSLGFRGPELSPDQRHAYRIVALGESTTFGLTLTLDDKPWPRQLESMIAERIRPSRPVEVINAGVPGANLRNNLHRLARDILPLQPDLIISYHGVNGFPLLDPAMPPTHGKPPPRYQPRALRLLAQAEYRAKLIRYNRSRTARLFADRPAFTNVLDTEFARAYRSLIEVCATNGIRLAIANYSMAVNPASEHEVAEFYRGRYPELFWTVRANAAHSTLLEGLAREYPEVRFINTHPGLDGRPEHFIDLVHFSPEGKKLLTTAVFRGIEDLLHEDLHASSLARHPRPGTATNGAGAGQSTIGH